MTMLLDPKIVPPGQGEIVAMVGQLYTYLARGEDTGGNFTLIRALLPEGGKGPPPHTHTREDESFYILEGEVTFTIAGKETVASAGTFVFGPRDIPHTFKNTGTGHAQMLITLSPSGLEKFFDEVGEPVTDRFNPPPPPSPEHIQKILKNAPRYGLTMHV